MLVEGFAFSHFIATCVYVFSLIFARRLIERVIKSQVGEQWSQEYRLKAIGHVRSAILVLVIVGLIFIWAEELRSFTVSVFAIAVAVVMAFMELIRCLHGYLLLLRSNAYSLGDRIEIGQFKGDVLSVNLLYTILLEVGIGGKSSNQGTGKRIIFPNSILLTSTIVNSSFLEDFSFVSIDIPMMATEDWQRAKSILLELAQEESQPFLEKARRRSKEMAQKHGLEPVSVEPRVFIRMTAPSELLLTLRVASPWNLRDRIEQSIINHFLERYFQEEKSSIT
ncbi:mechanosensitive ion channel family protein [Candidatus Similichlamydia epinepheli]|uniref:mechanosensitive ion channel family protein n=1 Tax=Candidatus Similichlamydia epinepheli TaxID=1903953 RepID=UPI0013006025|nr:mechanosensitive ion channel family protein [Candidatus Similichlamydia epinepheli]